MNAEQALTVIIFAKQFYYKSMLLTTLYLINGLTFIIYLVSIIIIIFSS